MLAEAGAFRVFAVTIRALHSFISPSTGRVEAYAAQPIYAVDLSRSPEAKQRRQQSYRAFNSVYA
jgi:hypothetical protein